MKYGLACLFGGVVVWRKKLFRPREYLRVSRSLYVDAGFYKLERFLDEKRAFFIEDETTAATVVQLLEGSHEKADRKT